MRQVRLATAWDLPFLAILLAGAWVAGAARPEPPVEGLRITGAAGTREVPLRPGRIEVAGTRGPSMVEVGADGAVRFLSSPCPYHLCMTMGPIRRAGEARVCVPNRVMIELTGRSRGGELDGVTR